MFYARSAVRASGTPIIGVLPPVTKVSKRLSKRTGISSGSFSPAIDVAVAAPKTPAVDLAHGANGAVTSAPAPVVPAPLPAPASSIASRLRKFAGIPTAPVDTPVPVRNLHSARPPSAVFDALSSTYKVELTKKEVEIAQLREELERARRESVRKDAHIAHLSKVVTLKDRTISDERAHTRKAIENRDMEISLLRKQRSRSWVNTIPVDVTSPAPGESSSQALSHSGLRESASSQTSVPAVPVASFVKAPSRRALLVGMAGGSSDRPLPSSLRDLRLPKAAAEPSSSRIATLELRVQHEQDGRRAVETALHAQRREHAIQLQAQDTAHCREAEAAEALLASYVEENTRRRRVLRSVRMAQCQALPQPPPPAASKLARKIGAGTQVV
ncbi:unnamed protein product [Peniophora sp. CBMAI 1063]|nr:unnamed protein product [Peniophora sp. CBMAI 1063]